MSIFQKSVINKHLKNLDKNQVEKAYQKFRNNYSPSKIEKIKKLKEEEYQDGFLRDLFVDVFGYTLKPDDDYNLAREFKNQGDGKKADGAILKNEKAVAVIELKSTKTKDLKSITEQAFNYKNNQPECKYVITSNFQKLRFYIDYANEFEEFDLFYLQKKEFELLYLILNINSVFSDLPQKLKEETKFHEQNISDKLYKDYSYFKNKLFNNLIEKNPENDKLTLFKKSQKLLDRFLFILFAEDSGLLPPNSISRIIDTYNKLEELDAYKPIYDIYKQYFGYLNIGRKGKTNVDDIPAYNGGLFYNDDLLDNLKIDDKILIDDLLKLSEYDFNTEVDVNILGHIFEHSLSEIEEITAEIEGTTTDKLKSKRKKDGVFYTPKYITQYIVENTIGTLCNEKREELEIKEIEFDGTYRTKDGNLSVKGKKLYQKLNDYKEWLLSLKIIDPACGSGAFLNQALNFLIQEHKDIDDIIAELTNSALRLFDTEKTILENNLYGVDINEESVEIAKLSLWLRTAHKDRKLSNLNNNIKCGNSLIDDPKIAGDKSFDWRKEFSDIMQNGGFDIVIGNPPYAGRSSSINENEKNYIRKNYLSSEGKFELYQLFIEKCLLLTKKNDSFISLITPQTWLSIIQSKKLRKLVLENQELNEIIFLGKDVFEEASVDSVVFIINKGRKHSHINFLQSDNLVDSISKPNIIEYSSINKKTFSIPLNSSSDSIRLLDKITNNYIHLEDIGNWSDGVKVVGQAKSFAFQKSKYDSSFYPMIVGKDIGRYSLIWSGLFCCRDKAKVEAKNATDIRLRDESMFLREKILIRKTGSEIVATIDSNNNYYEQSLFSFGLEKNTTYELKNILAILNSTFANFLLKENAFSKKETFPQIRLHWLKEFPIPEISKEMQQFTIEKVDKLLILNEKIQENKTKFLNRVTDNFDLFKVNKKLAGFYELDFKTFVTELKKQRIKLTLVQQDEWEEYFNAYKNEINLLQDEVNATDKEIDQMVYKLYELTEEEIEIIEKI